jgi:hypothetical protein
LGGLISESAPNAVSNTKSKDSKCQELGCFGNYETNAETAIALPLILMKVAKPAAREIELRRRILDLSCIYLVGSFDSQ